MGLIERVDGELQRNILGMCGYVQLMTLRETLLEKQSKTIEPGELMRVGNALRVLDEIESRLYHILGFDDSDESGYDEVSD